MRFAKYKIADKAEMLRKQEEQKKHDIAIFMRMSIPKGYLVVEDESEKEIKHD